MTSYMPQMRRTLVHAAQRRANDARGLGSTQHRTPARPMRLPRPLVVGGTAGVLAATVAVALLISAGGSPSPAQALPILTTRAVPLSTTADHTWLATVIGGGRDGDASARAFMTANFNGYVLVNPDGSILCVALSSSTGGPGGTVASCGPTSSAEQTGMLMTWSWTSDDYDFVALVPAGGSLTLTDDGTTTNVPVDSNGVASGIVHDNSSVSLEAGGATKTKQLGPDAQPTTGPITAPGVASGPTAAPGPTAATGATS